MDNLISVILIIGLVYISLQQKTEPTRNMMLIITGLLAFCMLGRKVEGYCTIPADLIVPPPALTVSERGPWGEPGQYPLFRLVKPDSESDGTWEDVDVGLDQLEGDESINTEERYGRELTPAIRGHLQANASFSTLFGEKVSNAQSWHDSPASQSGITWAGTPTPTRQQYLKCAGRLGEGAYLSPGKELECKDQDDGAANTLIKSTDLISAETDRACPASCGVAPEGGRANISYSDGYAVDSNATYTCGDGEVLSDGSGNQYADGVTITCQEGEVTGGEPSWPSEPAGLQCVGPGETFPSGPPAAGGEVPITIGGFDQIAASIEGEFPEIMESVDRANGHTFQVNPTEGPNTGGLSPNVNYFIWTSTDGIDGPKAETNIILWGTDQHDRDGIYLAHDLNTHPNSNIKSYIDFTPHMPYPLATIQVTPRRRRGDTGKYRLYISTTRPADVPVGTAHTEEHVHDSADFACRLPEEPPVGYTFTPTDILRAKASEIDVQCAPGFRAPHANAHANCRAENQEMDFRGCVSANFACRTDSSHEGYIFTAPNDVTLTPASNITDLHCDDALGFVSDDIYSEGPIVECHEQGAEFHFLGCRASESGFTCGAAPISEIDRLNALCENDQMIIDTDARCLGPEPPAADETEEAMHCRREDCCITDPAVATNYSCKIPDTHIGYEFISDLPVGVEAPAGQFHASDITNILRCAENYMSDTVHDTPQPVCHEEGGEFEFVGCELVSHQSADCVGEWGEWGACSTACGDGTQTREYEVTVAAGGVACDPVDGAPAAGATQERVCNVAPCSDTNTCASFNCPNEDGKRHNEDHLNEQCPSEGCTELHCCETIPPVNAMCSTATCPPGRTLIENADQTECAGAECATVDEETCCKLSEHCMCGRDENNCPIDTSGHEFCHDGQGSGKSFSFLLGQGYEPGEHNEVWQMRDPNEQSLCTDFNCTVDKLIHCDKGEVGGFNWFGIYGEYLKPGEANPGNLFGEDWAWYGYCTRPEGSEPCPPIDYDTPKCFPNNALCTTFTESVGACPSDTTSGLIDNPEQKVCQGETCTERDVRICCKPK